MRIKQKTPPIESNLSYTSIHKCDGEGVYGTVKRHNDVKDHNVCELQKKKKDTQNHSMYVHRRAVIKGSQRKEFQKLHIPLMPPWAPRGSERRARTWSPSFSRPPMRASRNRVTRINFNSGVVLHLSEGGIWLRETCSQIGAIVIML